MFGIAAIDSGNVTRGVFALERILAADPNNAQARVEIARAYYQLGENEAARTEFQNVLQQQPPDDAKVVINRFLSAIDKNTGRATRFAAYLGLDVGYDSNVNNATSTSSFAIPALPGFGQFTLNGNAIEKSSGFASLSGGASFQAPFDKHNSVFGSIALSGKANYAGSASNFDTSSIDLVLGGQHKVGVDTFTLAAQSGSYSVNSQTFRRANGINAQWQHEVDEHNQASIFFQAARLVYPGQTVRDVDRYVGGAGWGHIFAGDKTPVVFVSGYAGTENIRASNVPFLGNNLVGVRAGGQVTWTPKLVLFSSTSYEYRDYGGHDPLFIKSRAYNQFDMTIGARYLPGHAWTIQPQLSYTNNDSNIILNNYDRLLLSVGFRHDFNW